MDNNQKYELKATREKIIDELVKAGAEFKGNSCRCPFCDDKNPSAGIYESQNGWSFKCHKCGFHGDVFSIMAINQNCTEVEIFKSMNKDTPKETRKVTRFSSVKEAEFMIKNHKATFEYYNPETEKVDMFVFRIEEPGKGKRFLQGTNDGNGGVILKAPDKPWPLYGRKQIQNTDKVIVVEGEKAVHAIRGIDPEICATTNPGGAGKAHHTDWSMLAGKNVYLWPDNDDKNNKGVSVGIEHMKDVYGMLDCLYPAPKVNWIDIESLNLPPKGDAHDFFKLLPKDQQKEELYKITNNAKPSGVTASLLARLDDIFTGKRETIKIPWPNLDEATMALTPGSIVLLCGEGGAAKSLTLLQLCQYWHFDLKHEVVLYELEEDRNYHVTRALAQKTGEPWLINDRIVKENIDTANKLHRENADFIEGMGRMIKEAPIGSLSHEKLAEWVDVQASSGKRIICIDPITAAEATKNIHIADQDFLEAVRPTIVNHGASLVLLTHPKKGGSGDAIMDNLSGGSCWSRFCQTILWLKNLGEETEFDILLDGLKTTGTADRVMHVVKARNGFGGGRSFAMNLDRLILKEEGQILKKKKGRKNE